MHASVHVSCVCVCVCPFSIKAAIAQQARFPTVPKPTDKPATHRHESTDVIDASKNSPVTLLVMPLLLTNHFSWGPHAYSRTYGIHVLKWVGATKLPQMKPPHLFGHPPPLILFSPFHSSFFVVFLSFPTLPHLPVRENVLNTASN